MISRFTTATALAVALAAVPALGQDNTNAQGQVSTSASDANANSGSISGASSNNAGIGNSISGSNSNSDAVAITDSRAESNGNQQGQGQDQGQGQSQGQSANNAQDQGQGQTQGQSANNTQGQGQTATGGSSDQGQSQSSANTNSLGQTASNSQGVTVNQTWNTTQRKKTVQEFRTNTAVMLAASSSFSSDYCGGTTSGGASAAPIGISIGMSGPTFDNSCRYLRLAEKAGMLGANYYNMQQPEMSMRAMSLMSWAVCMAGPQQDKRTKGYNQNVAMQACITLGLLGSEASAPTPPATAQRSVTPQEASKPNVTPAPEVGTYDNPLPYKTPRGDATRPQDVKPLAMASPR